jgi:hypothetical protein
MLLAQPVQPMNCLRDLQEQGVFQVGMDRHMQIQANTESHLSPVLFS